MGTGPNWEDFQLDWNYYFNLNMNYTGMNKILNLQLKLEISLFDLLMNFLYSGKNTFLGNSGGAIFANLLYTIPLLEGENIVLSPLGFSLIMEICFVGGLSIGSAWDSFYDNFIKPFFDWLGNKRNKLGPLSPHPSKVLNYDPYNLSHPGINPILRRYRFSHQLID